MDPLLQVLLAVLGGGAVVKLLDLLLQERRKRRSESSETTRDILDKEERIVNLVIGKLTEQRDAAWERVAILERKLEAMELEIQGLRMSQAHDPFPRWMINLEGEYIYVNTCFEDQFLRPKGLLAQHVIGKKHEHIWPSDFAGKLLTLDQLAMKRPDGRARAQLQCGESLMTVYKLPVRHKGSGAVVAYEGWITDIETTEV